MKFLKYSTHISISFCRWFFFFYFYLDVETKNKRLKFILNVSIDVIFHTCFFFLFVSRKLDDGDVKHKKNGILSEKYIHTIVRTVNIFSHYHPLLLVIDSSFFFFFCSIFIFAYIFSFSLFVFLLSFAVETDGSICSKSTVNILFEYFKM